MDKDSPVRTRHWRYKLNPNKEGARMQQWHELMSIRIKSTDDPTLLFQKISENERKYRHKTKLLTENEKRAIIILLAPEIYTDTIFAVRMQSRMQNYGQEPSLKELRKHMCSYFRVLDTIREKSDDNSSDEYEDVSDEEEGCRKGMIHTKSDEEELKRMGKGELVADASDDDDDEDDDGDDDVRWVPLPYYDKRVNDARKDGSRHNDIQPKTPKRPLSQDSMDSYGSSGSSGSSGQKESPTENPTEKQTESQTDNSAEHTGCLCPLASVEMFGCLCNLSREDRMKQIDIVQAEIQRQTKAKRLSETQSTKDTSTKSSSTKSEIVSLPIFSDEEESTMSDLDRLRSEVLSPETLSRIQPEIQPKTLPDLPQEIQPSDQRAMKRISVASGTSYEVWDHRSIKWVSEQDIQRETTLETPKRPDPPSHKEHKKDSSMETNLTDLHKKRSSILLSGSQKSLTSWIEDDISDVVKNSSSRSLSSYSQNPREKSDRSLKSNPSQDLRDKSDKSMKLSDLLENYEEEENSADIKIADVQKKRDSMAILRKKYDAWMEDDISDVVKNTSNRSLKKKGVERSDSRRSYASSTHDEIEDVVKNKRRNSLADVVKRTSKITRKPITSTNTSDRSLEKIDLETKDLPEGVKVRGWTYETNSSVAENIELHDSRTGHTSWMDDDIVDFVKNTPRNSAVGVVKSTPKASIRKAPTIDSPTESPTDFTLSSSLDVHAFYSPDKSSPYTLKGRKKKTADFAKLRPQPLTMDSTIGDKHPTKILDSERRRDSTSSRSNSTKKKHWLKLATTDKDVLWN